MNTEPKSYKFSTFQEFFDRVPVDRMEEALSEIGDALILGRRQMDLIMAISEQAGQPITDGSLRLPDELEWIDDGLKIRGATICDTEGNNPLGITIRPE